MIGAPLMRGEHNPLPTDRPLRILVGAKEIGGQIPEYAEGFRALGHTLSLIHI